MVVLLSSGAACHPHVTERRCHIDLWVVMVVSQCEVMVAPLTMPPEKLNSLSPSQHVERIDAVSP